MGGFGCRGVGVVRSADWCGASGWSKGCGAPIAMTIVDERASHRGGIRRSVIAGTRQGTLRQRTALNAVLLQQGVGSLGWHQSAGMGALMGLGCLAAFGAAVAFGAAAGSLGIDGDGGGDAGGGGGGDAKGACAASSSFPFPFPSLPFPSWALVKENLSPMFPDVSRWLPVRCGIGFGGGHFC